MTDTFPLHQISGISQFNARRTPPTDEESAELCASILAKGVTTPLLLRIEHGFHVALDGGRRLLALRALADRGEIGADYPVPHLIFTGSDEEAAEVSLISFVQRRDLHPVDEFERFGDLSESFGLDAEAIARKTGKSLRYVKQRLRLGRLAPKIREAWRAGRIVAETAQAFAASESHEEQERVFDALGDAIPHARIDIIRNRLSGETIAADAPQAIFVGADAYVAAGGRIDEQLFGEQTRFLDGPLLKRLAEEKIEAIGRATVETEGWGWACYDHKDSERWADSSFEFDASDGDYTEEEQGRLDELDAGFKALPLEERKGHFAEIAEIERLAVLRAIPLAERATQGVYLSLSGLGDVIVARGIVHEPGPEESNADAGDDGEADAEPRRAGQRRAAPAGENGAPSAPAPEPIGKSLRAVLDETVDEALHDVVASNVSLALVFAVAKLGSSYGGETIDLSRGFGHRTRAPKSALLKAIAGERFEKALALCVAAHIEDVTALPVAFAELVAGLFASGKATSFDPSRILLAVASRLSDMEGALDRVLDREAYFKAAPKDVAIEAVRALHGDADANDTARLKKADCVARAAMLAKDKHWLPDALRTALEAWPQDERTTAEAMREAIDADEERTSDALDAAEDRSEDDAEGEGADAPEDDEHASFPPDAPLDRAAGAAVDAEGAQAEEDRAQRTETVAAVEYQAPLFARFLREHVAFGRGEVKATALLEAYVERARPTTALTATAVGAIVKKIGVEKEKRPDGVYYVGLSLRAPRAEARQAAE